MAIPSSLAQRRQPGTPNRSFTLPPRLSDSGRRHEPSAPPSSSAIETLFEHPAAKIVCFNAAGTRLAPRAADQEGLTPDSPVGVLPWRSDREYTISTGPLRLYRIHASTAFITSGKIVHPIMPKSECWCVDGESIFVLRVRGVLFWRIELPNDTADERRFLEDLKAVFAKLLQYERTPCPFKRGFYVELPETPPTIKRPWKPKQSPQAAVEGADSPSSLPSRPHESRDSVRPDRADSVWVDAEPQSTPLPMEARSADSAALTVERHISTFEDLSVMSCIPEMAQGSKQSLESTPTPLESSHELEEQALYQSRGAPTKRELTEEPPVETSLRSLLAGEFQANYPPAHPIKADITPVEAHVPLVENETAEAEATEPEVPGVLNPATPLAKKPAKDAGDELTTLTPNDSPIAVQASPDTPGGPTSTSSLVPQNFSSSIPPTSTYTRKQRIENVQTWEPGPPGHSSSLDSFSTVSISPISPAFALDLPSGQGARRRESTALSFASSTPGSSERSYTSATAESDRHPDDSAAEDLSGLRGTNGNTTGQTARLSAGPLRASSLGDKEDPSTAQLALRSRIRRRRRYSPPPDPANIHLPSTQHASPYLSSHVLLRTCSLLLGPPVQIVALMLNLAARIANGALRGSVFTYAGDGEPVTCAWDFVEEDVGRDETQDDYGISLVGRTDGTITHREEVDDSWDVD